jgi:hypothetical protein
VRILAATSCFLILMGCTSRGGIIGRGGGGDDDDSSPDGDDDSATNDDDDAAPPFDCAQVSDTPISRRIVDGARGYHGLAFDGNGHIIGSDGNALIRATYDGQAEVFVPGLGRLEQIIHMPDGDLAIAMNADGGVHRVTPSGGLSLIASDVRAYGLVWGPDEKIWALNNSMVSRIDPATGTNTPIGVWTIPFQPHSGDFSKDFTKFYVGLIGDGTTAVVNLDDEFRMDGEPEPFAFDVGNGWHDGVAVDNCGWIYMPDFRTSRLYRLSPAGETELYFSWSNDSSHYGHGVVWGSGIGGWRADALYLPMPYNNNTVQEIVTGTFSRTWEGTIINPPAGGDRGAD